jgi:hypothetical protein
VELLPYTFSLWIQKSVVLLLYRQILDKLPWPHYIMKVYWVVLCATYLGAQSVTFVECHPFHRYWQVVPDPGTELSAYNFLYLRG